jgi:hypothetical protein
MDKIVFSFIWILLLLFITWPIAGFCAGFWLFLQPFEACFSFGASIPEGVCVGLFDDVAMYSSFILFIIYCIVKEITSFLEK